MTLTIDDADNRHDDDDDDHDVFVNVPSKILP